MAGKNKFDSQRDANPVALGRVMVDYTPSGNSLPAGVRAVLFNDDGTCDLIDGADNAVAGVPVFSMQSLPIVPDKVTAMTGPTKCYLIY